jgi:hypothetical protein
MTEHSWKQIALIVLCEAEGNVVQEDASSSGKGFEDPDS